MIELSPLSKDETDGCLIRAKNGPPLLLPGFMSELAMAKLCESRGVAGAYDSCVTQQARGKGRRGPDFWDVDVKSTDAYGSMEEAFAKLHLQVKQKDLDAAYPAPRFAFVLVIKGKRYFVGWVSLEEMRSGEVCLLGGEIGRRLPVAKLRDPEQLFSVI